MLQLPSRRPLRRFLTVLAVTAAVVAGTTSIATAQASRPPVLPHAMTDGGAPAHSQLMRKGATVHYGVPTPNCAAPAAGHKACLSERIEPATKDTPGAIAYTAPRAATAGPSGLGYTPAALATAYGYSPASAVGATQTVAIVDAYDDPNALGDLNAFDAEYGLPAETGTSFRKVNQSGSAATASLPAEDDGWAGEIALDVETVRGVCNRCDILLVETDSTSNTDFDVAVNTAARMGATEISNSYGGAEYADGGTTSSSADLAAYDHPGIVVTAASGDDGWYDWDCANICPQSDTSSNAPEAPASYPTVVAVGGTDLALNANGSRQSERVWNENGSDDRNGLGYDPTYGVGWFGAQGASGGGCSLLYKAPAFQATVKGYASLGCQGRRSSNDVAALADPQHGFDVYDSINNGSHPGNWWPEGGTSLASPVIAAMWALAGGAGGVDYPAKNLYGHFARTSSSFHDVTSGGNGFCGGDTLAGCEAYLSEVSGGAVSNPNAIAVSDGSGSSLWLGMLDCGLTQSGTPLANNRQCNAGPGFDGPSGVGTPNGLAAFRPVAPAASVVWPALVKPGVTAAFRISRITDPVMSPAATYTWTWGDGTTTRTTALSAGHRYARAGTYTVSLRVVDRLGHTGSLLAKRYVAGRAPVVKVKGPKKAHRHKRVTFKATAIDPNTGGRITGYTWRVGHKVVGHGAKLKYRFAHKGKSKVQLTVTDNSGLSGKSAKHTVRVR